ncbi:MAG: TonB-dependent receptor [Undibacterium sp.]|nr:TonB-dependent receptor [Opitutaceae bacterium]
MPDEIKVQGLELEAVYQPNRSFNAGANFTYSEANFVNGPLPGSIQTTPAFSPSSPSGNFGAYPAGDYRVPGLPRWLANAYASYTHASGFGASVGLNTQGEQNLDLFGVVKIPAQQTWNAGVFYKTKRLELRLDFLNLADEFNWRATSTPFAGADLVTRELPFHVQGVIKYTF